MKIFKIKNKSGGVYFTRPEVEIKDMIGLVFTKVYRDLDDERLIFECKHGQFIFKHEQDCCESVYIESIVGCLQDLVDTPLMVAEEVTSNYEEASESGTWTFYKFATEKGYVDIRWLGQSNGYYSESVSLLFIPFPGVVLQEVFDCEIVEYN